MSPAIIMKQCKRHCVACNLPTLDDRRTSERPPQQLPFKSHCGWPGLCRPHCLLWRHTTTGVCFVSLIKARVVHYIIILSTASCELWRNTDAILMPPLGHRMHRYYRSICLSAITLHVSCRETTKQSKLDGRA